MLRSIGVPELVTHSLAEYEEMALGLACDTDRLGAIRRKIQENVPGSALFDAQRFCRNIEAAYIRMWDAQESGNPARGFQIQGA